MANGCSDSGTQFLVAAGGAAGGGAALGAVAGGVAWVVAEDAARLWGRLMRREIPEASLPGLETLLAGGGFLGGYIGFLVWLYERVA